MEQLLHFFSKFYSSSFAKSEVKLSSDSFSSLDIVALCGDTASTVSESPALNYEPISPMEAEVPPQWENLHLSVYVRVFQALQCLY